MKYLMCVVLCAAMMGCSRGVEPKGTPWEIVNAGEETAMDGWVDDQVTRRLPVPNGWIYRTTRNGRETSVFVPDPFRAESK